MFREDSFRPLFLTLGMDLLRLAFRVGVCSLLMGEDGGAIRDDGMEGGWRAILGWRVVCVLKVSGVEARVGVGADGDCNSSSESSSYRELKG